jgi:hypothetical protein
MAHLDLGFGAQRTGDSSKAKIDIKVTPYKVELSSLYIQIPQHFNLLQSTTTPLSAEESRKRLVKSHVSVPFEELAAFATEVFKHKQASLKGKPTEEQWAAELLLWEKEHTLLIRGY